MLRVVVPWNRISVFGFGLYQSERMSFGIWEKSKGKTRPLKMGLFFLSDFFYFIMLMAGKGVENQ